MSALGHKRTLERAVQTLTPKERTFAVLVSSGYKSRPSRPTLRIARLEQRIADLQVIADWRDELQSKIRRAILRFEFLGLDVEEQQALQAEVETFKRTCGWLVGASWEAIPAREAA